MPRRRLGYGASPLAVVVAPLAALVVLIAFLVLLRGLRYEEPLLAVFGIGI